MTSPGSALPQIGTARSRWSTIAALITSGKTTFARVRAVDMSTTVNAKIMAISGGHLFLIVARMEIFPPGLSYSAASRLRSADWAATSGLPDDQGVLDQSATDPSPGIS